MAIVITRSATWRVLTIMAPLHFRNNNAMSVNTNIQNTLAENGRNTTLLLAPLVVAAGPIPYPYGMVRIFD